ncbi:MAG: cysteine hydrolase [Candidatus Heimdallarchaeota archaeon]|nr:cysteine hydrolase [Candidatus Heimdallarchaeota archaeon]
MNKALVLIDIQEDYFPGGKMELIGAVEASLNAKKLIETCRINKIPIIHVRHISKSKSASFFIPDTDGINFNKNVLPLDNEIVITKHFPNSFRETELKSHLDNLGIKDVIFAGMMSHMCVDGTVRAAFDFGFTCTVVQDACATRNLSFGEATIPSDNVHGSFMSALSGTYAKVLTTKEILGDI